MQVALHPLPKPDDMLAASFLCKIFSEIDLKYAFQELETDENFQELFTVSTHLGVFRPKRLPYGIASSPALWQETMNKLFKGLHGTF